MSRSGGLSLMLVATYGLALYAYGCGGSSHGATLPTSPPVPSDPGEACGTCATNTGAPAPGTYSGPGDPAPRVSVTTAEGVLLSYPVWLDDPQHSTERAALLAEIRAANVPAGTTLVVLDPGAYWADYSPTLLAMGEWRAPSTIFCAWRGVSTDPRRLPALEHELGHQIHNDAAYGH